LAYIDEAVVELETHDRGDTSGLPDHGAPHDLSHDRLCIGACFRVETYFESLRAKRRKDGKMAQERDEDTENWEVEHDLIGFGVVLRSLCLPGAEHSGVCLSCSVLPFLGTRKRNFSDSVVGFGVAEFCSDSLTSH
jgi:hypothetical protein